jgi:hypothetical protein
LRAAARQGGTLVVAFTLAGCLFDFGLPEPGGGAGGVGGAGGTNGGTASPPVFQTVGVPTWPPFGSGDVVRLDLVDADGDLDFVEARFAKTVRQEVSGSADQAVFPVEDLGEGYGDMQFNVEDQLGGADEAIAYDVLIDLHVPVIEQVTPDILPRAGGELWVWAADAWALGRATVLFEGGQAESLLPEQYPGTLGVAWDRTLFTIDVSTLPAGYGTATVVVADAAGNTTTVEVPLTIDANPPEVLLLAPAPGAVLSAPFQVEVQAADPELEPTWIEIFVGGTPATEGAGPSMAASLDPLDFAAGPTTIEAVAVDRAGNRSEPASVAVTLQ